MIVIFLQTPAYRDTVQGCDDLGTFEAFTDRVLAGYQSYVDALSPLRAEIAHVGMAYRHVRQTNVDLWRRLYAPDDFHPSPHGTWLQACVLYYSIWGAHDRPPLRYSAALWKSTRYFAPNAEQDGNDDDRLPAFPTTDEAMLLADVAWKIQCEYSQTKTGAEHDGADGGGNDPSPNANL
uniref:Uncharacterized protein n=1 Tax=Craspedostauros australis TaxID=1486917 RepID=A0A6T6G1X6_9STRA|eukprot:CAMPEP_0198117508 /NCGR_PEP_ID=MMETSP1442-20131203/18360_1 /TAXON_ID= /ORGANISM="Craspedostauros australis, Strain CCMP3328" /LENGTH=178 /DNA_ID=CAMNT_0043775569 /DNA_START=23 /DNA_END=559 /DNA_ORIENTATION=-